MKMPYVVGPPVRLKTDFFGRERQTAQFFETLAGPQVQCVSVLGLRRAGKTSFLQHVSHPEVMAAYLPDPNEYVMVYVDVSACKTASDFYNRVYRKLLSALPRVPAGAVRSQSAVDVYDLESLLHEFGRRRVVLLMDEFDQLRAADFSGDFMAELRALAGVWDFELGYVTASYWDLYRLGNFVGLPPTSPFYNIFYPTPIYLSGLSPDELNELVRIPAQRVGIAADDEDIALVRHLAGSLPFYVQAAASAWLVHKAQGNRATAAAIQPRLASELGPYFEQWWRHFSDVERDVLAAVAQEKPVGRLAYDEAELDEAVNRLSCYGVIGTTGDQLWADSALFANWVAEHTSRVKRFALAKPAAATSDAPRPQAKATPTPDNVFARIVEIAGDVSRQFERLPGVYARKSDAELRRHLELALQSGLPAAPARVRLLAVSETELVARIDGGNSMAIGCVTWLGQKPLLHQIDQLIGLLGGGRDCAALAVRVRQPEFSTVTAAIARALPFHPGYLGPSGAQDGRLAYRFHLNGDPHSELTLTVLPFHLPG